MAAEAAWAAGFFDGEGCVGTWKSHKRSSKHTRVVIQQIHPEVLERFQKAVGVGKVGGPYGPYARRPNQKAHWQYTAHGKEAVQTVYNVLKPYLSSVKRDQFLQTIKEFPC